MAIMNGAEIERLLTVLEENSNWSREEILRYVEEHKDQILADLEEKGESTIPVGGGDKIVLKKAA